MTMIRINLLPTRAVKKREAGRQVVVLFAGLLVLGLIGNFLWYSSRADVEAKNEEKIAQTNAQIAELEKVIGEVNNINKRRKEVEEKLKVLSDLRRGRGGPVKLMDALATAMPKKVWLKNFDEQNSDVKLLGSATSHDDVAEFMRGLSTVVWTPKGMGRLIEQKRDAKVSRVEMLAENGAVEELPVGQVVPFFTNIDLKSATQKTGGGPADRNVTTVDFEIQLKANYAT